MTKTFSYQNNKKTYLEVARVLAIFCVLFDHTGPRGSGLFTYTSNPLNIYASLLLAIFCKIGVPLFLMISGSLLLGKQESIKNLFQKRICRVAIVLLLFSFIRYLYECYIIKAYSFSLLNFVRDFLQDNIFLPYWYLYTYIGILLLLPLLRCAIQNIKKEHNIYFFIITLIFSTIVPIINYNLHISFAINMHLEMVVLYFISGYLAEQLYNDDCKHRVALFSLSMILIPLIYMFLLSVFKGTYREENGSAFVVELLYPVTLGIFMLLKTINWERLSTISKFFLFCGEMVFGLYLIEDYLRNVFAFIYDFLCPLISPMAACLVWLMVVFIVGIAIVWLIKHIPIIGKLI